MKTLVGQNQRKRKTKGQKGDNHNNFVEVSSIVNIYKLLCRCTCIYLKVLIHVDGQSIELLEYGSIVQSFPANLDFSNFCPKRYQPWILMN